MKIIVLCTGNSCRSQMAEAFLKMYDKNLIVYSAGVEAHGLNPIAMQVMDDISISISKHESTQISDKRINLICLIIIQPIYIK